MAETKIKSAEVVVPMIYAYSTPGVIYHEGWTKIGYTEKQTPEERVREQTHTVGIKYHMEWEDDAKYKDGTGVYFTDHDFHSYLRRKEIRREEDTEWFEIGGTKSKVLFDKFVKRGSDDIGSGQEYVLRKEQKEAVLKTKDFFENGGEEFLWNAKPRFGKTLSAYDLIQSMRMTNVLIVTDRPSISNSWAEDFFKFVYWRDEYEFITDTDALKGENRTLTREEYVDRLKNDSNYFKKTISFVSLQDLKGSVYFGGKFDKLKWIAKSDSGDRFLFDLLIVDESQEGVDTVLTEKAFNNINRKHTLYLSGTPFKALADNRFQDEQIYSWTYADEQEAKQNWADNQTNNPYDELPRLCLFTYQLPYMIGEVVNRGIDLSGKDNVSEYVFDMNEFFSTDESGKFEHEKEVKAFLHTLTTVEKYPYSTKELRDEMSHTLWLLNRVASAKALKKLLKTDPVFSEYFVVSAHGDKDPEDETSEEVEIQSKNSYKAVKDAIRKHSKTITISVKQLTVGVTIPEWSGILMLCKLNSASSYFQAVFRVQNPCLFSRDGKQWRKERAYVFDFDPVRTLGVYESFANNLASDSSKKAQDRFANINRLLSFFPIVGEDVDGKMVELNSEDVLTLPNKLKSEEVVNRGFMCNYLFNSDSIGKVFGSSPVLKGILSDLPPTDVGKNAKKKNKKLEIEKIPLDEKGEVIVSDNTVSKELHGLVSETQLNNFTYDVGENFNNLINAFFDNDEDKSAEIVKKIYSSIEDNVITPAVEGYNPSKFVNNKIKEETKKNIQRAVEGVADNFRQRKKIAEAEYSRAMEDADTPEKIAEAETKFNFEIQKAKENIKEDVQNAKADVIEEPRRIINALEKNKKNELKKLTEQNIRARLRGFSRTIPSFLMAYGDENLTLQNFEDYIDDDVFKEVTKISKEDFRFLRDGGDWIDPETGENGHFDGQLFDKAVFNDSVKKFLNKKDKLRNYFDDELDEDIFDYIPPQKYNQIFTPKEVVKRMVNLLEENNPGCFDDDTKTFADLYMKSGLFITEIVKRLYRSEKMKELYPNPDERVYHILTKQVFGMAPTKIIYDIAINYIFGFDTDSRIERDNFVQEDAAQDSKDRMLRIRVRKYFGDKVDFE